MFYSAYLPVVEDRRLPALHTAPPLLREHRLYQADWLLRYYHFSAQELLTEDEPNFDPYLDPKCTWAVRHPEFFPVEVNTAGKEELLRVPGIGLTSAIRILQARRTQTLGMAALKRIGVVLPRAQYFITCRGKAAARGFRWMSLYPRRCRMLPRPCKSWPPAAWRRIQPQKPCGRRRCNVLPSACDRCGLLL